MKRNLILGLAADYQWPHLKTFVCSLRSTSYQGDVVLILTSELNQETKERLEEKSINYIYVDREELLKKKGTRLPLTFLRISLYLNYLKQNENVYDNVMLTDTRDVVFQKDPFSFDFGSSLCFFMEPKTTLIKDEEWNSIWIIAALGTKIYNSIGNNPISCFGTIIGPAFKIIEYLELVETQSSRIKIMIWGIEQGIHNYIVQTRLIENASIFSTEEGPIFTTGAGYTQDIQQDNDGFFLNERNNVIHVIHQYDRHSVLKAYFDNKYH
jgi:hypothetical protein